MYYIKKLATVAIAAGAVALLAATPSDAEARRGFHRAPVYRAPAARYYRPATRAYYGRPAYNTRGAYYSGHRGYGYGRGVRVGAPGVGISIGF